MSTAALSTTSAQPASTPCLQPSRVPVRRAPTSPPLSSRSVHALPDTHSPSKLVPSLLTYTCTLLPHIPPWHPGHDGGLMGWSPHQLTSASHSLMLALTELQTGYMASKCLLNKHKFLLLSSRNSLAPNTQYATNKAQLDLSLDAPLGSHVHFHVCEPDSHHSPSSVPDQT